MAVVSLKFFFVLQSIVSKIEIPRLKIDMTCNIENSFYWLVCFHCKYLRAQNLKNIALKIKRHVWADTVLKSRCGHSEILHSETEIHFMQDRKCFLCGKIKHELRVRSYALKSTSYEFKPMIYELKSTSYEFKFTSYEFKFTSYEFKSTSYEFKFTS